jgi:hypothetical protein
MRFLKRNLRRSARLDARLLWLRNKFLAATTGYYRFRGYNSGDRQEGKNILIATSMGGHLAAAQMDAVLAAGLIARNCNVDVLLCDGVLDACQMCEPRIVVDAERLLRKGIRAIACEYCAGSAEVSFKSTGAAVKRYSELIEKDEIDAIRSKVKTLAQSELEVLIEDQYNLGEHIQSGAKRFFAKADISDEPRKLDIMRLYATAAITSKRVVERMLRNKNYDVIVAHHGIYIPQGVICEVARMNKCRVVTWHHAYRKNTFIFSHNDTYHKTLMNEATEGWMGMTFSENMEMRIMDYLKARETGKNDWVHYTKGSSLSADPFEKIGLDKNKPIVSCFTNVAWDAQLHYPKNAFRDMMEWLRVTVEEFCDREDISLVIRVHPAEKLGAVPSRQPVIEEIRKWNIELGKNVFIIDPSDEISSYTLASISDCALIYGTKMGVELSARGIPVIAAGEAWSRGKGFTIDVENESEYREVLRRLPIGQKLTTEETNLAKRYAYHYFFRRMIEVKCFIETSSWPPYRFNGDEKGITTKGLDSGMDIIFSGIIDNDEFVQDQNEHQVKA